jgi:hypothetical protein
VRQTLPFLVPELASAVLHDGHFRLYRHILPPTEQRLGFIGYASSTACPLTAEISAHWLSQTFSRGQRLPTVHEMEAEIQRVHAWLTEVFPGRPHGYFLGPYLMHHIDDLLTDMGLPTQRTRNVFTEYLGRSHPRDTAMSLNNGAHCKAAGPRRDSGFVSATVGMEPSIETNHWHIPVRQRRNTRSTRWDWKRRSTI